MSRDEVEAAKRLVQTPAPGSARPAPGSARHQAALIRVRRALDKIQEAQNYLSRACSDLDSVCYGHPERKRVFALRDKVHAEWYRVRALFDDPRIELDREPAARDLDETRGVES